ncbi:MAG: preprotein translocase subunit SecG [Candidatus Acidiferrales bacterium]
MPRELKWAISFVVGAGLLALGWRMYAFLVTLHIVVCLTLMLVVLLQSGEAADLAGAFGGAGSQTAFGPRGAATFLTKATTWCAVMFLFTSMALTMHVSTRGGAGAAHSILQEFSKPSSSKTVPPINVPLTLPMTPTPTPAPPQPASSTPPPPSK